MGNHLKRHVWPRQKAIQAHRLGFAHLVNQQSHGPMVTIQQQHQAVTFCGAAPKARKRQVDEGAQAPLMMGDARKHR
jgi:hypothetical protein